MEINQLLESSNSFKSLQADAARLAEKWSASGLLEGIGDEKVKGNMAVILENQAKQIVAEANATQSGGSGFSAGAGENWAGVALPLVRKVFAQIVAQDFVSVQPMNLPSGLVFYLDFKYGTATNGRGDGTNLYGNVTEGSSKMGEDVDVSGGLYGAGQFGYTINQVEGSVASAAVTSALLKDVGFDASLTLGDYEVVQIPLSSIPNYDAEGIRAFTLANSGSVTLHKQFTKISGSNLVFVQSASGGVNDSDNVQVAYHKQPTDNTRGDFEADSTAAVDTSITIPEIDVKFNQRLSLLRLES
jgi:hypothetical protein